MTSPAASWLVRLNPRLPLLAFAVLWLAQSGCWLLRESRRELAPETQTSTPLASTPPTPSFEDPLPAETAAALPVSPFTSKKLEALNDASDKADPPAEAPSVSESDVTGVSTSSVPANASSAPAETNAVDRAATLRYRGYMQTHRGVLIAFVEDLESKAMHRLEVGGRIHEWTLQGIARKNIVLVSGPGSSLSIPRDSGDPPPTTPPAEKPPQATPQDKPAPPTPPDKSANEPPAEKPVESTAVEKPVERPADEPPTAPDGEDPQP